MWKQKYIHTPEREIHDQSMFIYVLLEISSRSHSPRTERPSRASSSACVGIDPGVNAQSPKESPRLSRDPNHIRAHSASGSLETFCFYIWVRAQAQFVCIVYKKTQQKTTGFIWDTWPTITHKKNKSSISLLCVWRLFFSELGRDISYKELWCQISLCLCSNIQMVNILITQCSEGQLTPLLSIVPSNTAVYLNHQDLKHTP